MLSPRRRRALTLLALALASGGLAASEVRGRIGEVERRTGSPLPVLVAASDIPAGAALTAGDVTRRAVPAAFVPPDALSDPAEADGQRSALALPRGSYVTAATLAPPPGEDPQDEDAPGPPVARGERAVEIAVASAGSPAGSAEPGARVDVVVTTEDGDGGGRTYVALEDVELLALSAAGSEEGAPEGPQGARALATLRVRAADASFLVAAQSFAREVRLLVRPAGDRRPLRRPSISRDDL